MFKTRIAIIADQRKQRERIAELLAPIDAEVMELASDLASSAVLRSSRPDLLIAVITTSKETEIGWYCHLKANPTYLNLPLILIGDTEGAEDIAQGLATNAFIYLKSSNLEQELLPATRSLISSDTSNHPPVQVLVVDDSPSVRAMLAEELGKARYDVITAEDGRQALAILERSVPDIILSDVYMPELSGIELCRILHADARYSTIPFIVMSTENDAGNMKKMMQYGAAAFIIKPFNVEQLLMTLNKIFSYEFRLLLKEKERLDSEQRLLLAGIASLVNGLEARDHYTRGHSERVAKVLAGLVRINGGSNYEVERAQIAGRLHDIGKIGIRDSVLLKPGKLDKEEFDHIKEHPLIGTAIIEAIPSIADILPVVLYHHEKFDGSGYPYGLKGDAIPLWARMTAVADTYDALTSDRPYRNGSPHDKALAIIREAAGSHLCPECAQLFLNAHQHILANDFDKSSTPHFLR